jgi:hypothetical protein
LVFEAFELGAGLGGVLGAAGVSVGFAERVINAGLIWERLTGEFEFGESAGIVAGIF